MSAPRPDIGFDAESSPDATAIPRRPSALRRLQHTPMRDLLRGRISGRLDMRFQLAASGLPDPIRRLVHGALCCTRLTRLEQGDVAAELIAHFQDGLHAGRTADELAGSFGDPRRAGRLIGRAKRRSRPLLWRAVTAAGRAALLTAAICVVAYVWSAARLYLAEPTVTFDILAEINRAGAQIPQEQRAWPLYLEAARRLTPLSEIPGSGYSWRESKREDWAAWVAANQETLTVFRAAAARPHLGVELGTEEARAAIQRLFSDAWSPPGESTREQRPVEWLLWSIRLIQRECDLAEADARLAILADESEQAVTDCCALLAAAWHVRELPYVTADLLSNEMIRLASQLVGELLAEHADAFSHGELVRLSHALAALQGGAPLRVHIEKERFWSAEYTQRAFDESGRPLESMLAQPRRLMPFEPGAWQSYGRFSLPILGLLAADRDEWLDEQRRIIGIVAAYADKPLWERGANLGEIRLPDTYSLWHEVRFPRLTLSLGPDPYRVNEAELVTQERDAVLVALALELFHRDHSAWPGLLDDLSPQYLPRIPPDRYDGRPLRYRSGDGRPLLYSLGADRDDDGGRLPDVDAYFGAYRANQRARGWSPGPAASDDSQPEAWPPPVDGDWILWPTFPAESPALSPL